MSTSAYDRYSIIDIFSSTSIDLQADDDYSAGSMKKRVMAIVIILSVLLIQTRTISAMISGT